MLSNLASHICLKRRAKKKKKKKTNKNPTIMVKNKNIKTGLLFSFIWVSWTVILYIQGLVAFELS